MANKRDVIIENAKVEKLVVYTNDKKNEFVQIVLTIGERKFFICDQYKLLISQLLHFQ